VEVDGHEVQGPRRVVFFLCLSLFDFVYPLLYRLTISLCFFIIFTSLNPIMKSLHSLPPSSNRWITFRIRSIFPPSSPPSLVLAPPVLPTLLLFCAPRASVYTFSFALNSCDLSLGLLLVVATEKPQRVDRRDSDLPSARQNAESEKGCHTTREKERALKLRNEAKKRKRAQRGMEEENGRKKEAGSRRNARSRLPRSSQRIHLLHDLVRM